MRFRGCILHQGGTFPRSRHSFDSILVLYQIFRFVTIPKEKAISQGYSFFVFTFDWSYKIIGAFISPIIDMIETYELDSPTGFVKQPKIIAKMKMESLWDIEQ